LQTLSCRRKRRSCGGPFSIICEKRKRSHSTNPKRRGEAINQQLKLRCRGVSDNAFDKKGKKSHPCANKKRGRLRPIKTLDQTEQPGSHLPPTPLSPKREKKRKRKVVDACWLEGSTAPWRRPGALRRQDCTRRIGFSLVQGKGGGERCFPTGEGKRAPEISCRRSAAGETVDHHFSTGGRRKRKKTSKQF